MNRRLLLIFVLLLALIPSLYLSYIHSVDSFLYTPLSNISEAYYTGRLGSVTTEQPVYVLLLYTISAICNIPPLQMAYMPIGALIFPLCIYALSRKILESRTIPILLLLYFAFDYSLYTGHYSVLAYAWAHPLFFIFVLLYIMYSNSDRRNPSLIAFILLVFTCLVFLHPTYVFWAMSFAVALNIIIAICKVTKVKSMKLIPTPYLTVCLFVMYFGFNQLFFGFYVHRVILIEPEVISEQFFQMIQSFLGLGTGVTVPYQISVGAPTSVIGYAAFARTSILVSCILIGALSWVKKNYHVFAKKFDNMLTLMVALFIAGMMHTIGYALYGHISMRFMILLFPIIAVLFLKKAGLKKVANVMVTLIVVLAVAQTASFWSPGPQFNNVDVESEPPSDWMISHTQGQVVFLSDFLTSQMVKYYFSSVGRDVVQRFFTSNLFGDVVTGDKMITVAEFVVINKGMYSTGSVGWALYEPLGKYTAEIEDNVHLNQIYDDGREIVLRSTYYN